MTEPTAVAVVVLAGGRARRFGGGDKTAARLHDSTVLDHLLDELPVNWPVLVVGTERATRRPVEWAREEPPFGGPVAGLAAGLAVVSAPIVVVIAGDQPYAGPVAPTLAATLATADDAVDGVVATDPSGRSQHLLGAYRAAALRRVIPLECAGMAVRSVVAHLRVVTHPVSARSAHDIDTLDDLHD